MKLWQAVALAVTGALIAWLFCHGTPPKPAPDSALRTDQLVAVLQDSGWVVVTAEKMGEISWKVSDLEGDTSVLNRRIAQLAREAAVAGAQVRAVTELYATAHAEQLKLAGQVHGDTLRRLADPTYAQLPSRGDSVTWSYEDSTFTIKATYQPPNTLWIHDLLTRIALAAAITQGPDGRVLFSAIAKDPRVSVRMARAEWVPLPPVQVCGWKQKAQAMAVGGLVTEGVRLLVPRLR